MAMDHLRPYRVRVSGHASGPVEAWSGYPLQFAGQRRFGWQDEMTADLRDALAGLAVSPSDVLSGTYLSTDESRCDVENRLFTNPGTLVFPKAVRSIRFERGLGPPPEPPTPVSRVDGQLHYYRYCLGGMWQWWEPAVLLARWHRVTRRVADDGNCLPVWLAMKQAAAAGQVEVLGPAPDDAVLNALRTRRSSCLCRKNRCRSGVRHEHERRRLLPLITGSSARSFLAASLGKPGATSRPGQRRRGAGHGLAGRATGLGPVGAMMNEEMNHASTDDRAPGRGQGDSGRADRRAFRHPAYRDR
jgi:hypothetical protein